MWPLTTPPAHTFGHRPQPDFLIISPPKTGSTWLATNLRHHPQIFIPEVKEVKYFSSLFKWVDFDWYCRHFDRAGARRAGEASPSYAALPVDRIRLIRQLMPDVKLVFLMRDPVARAWSHAKHNHHYHEANFTTAEPTPVTDDQWRENFAHDWPLVSGDYLGQLSRWMSVFPADQLYVGFYESIASQPANLLREVLGFLGVDPDIDLSRFPLQERILPGPSGDLPPQLAPSLRSLLRGRTEELVDFLRQRFGLESPPEWENTLGPTNDTLAEPVPAFSPDADDGYINGVVEQEEQFASGYRVVLADYHGYDIAFHRGQLHAISRLPEPICIRGMDEPRMEQLRRERSCLTALTLADLKERVIAQLFQQAEARSRAIEEELRRAREATARLEAALAELTAEVRRPSRARRLVRALLKPAGPTGAWTRLKPR
jgi:hypothetical protein